MQTHCVKPKELRRTCEIENLEHAGEGVSDVKLEFCNTILPDVDAENFLFKVARWSYLKNS